MNTTTRLCIAAILVVLLAASSYLLPELLKPKNVVLPGWNLADMPRQFGSWQSAKVEVNPEIEEQILRDADAVVNRAYVDDADHIVSVHVALFRDLDAGVLHSPINCYRGNGWREVSREQVKLRGPEESSIPVSLSTWEREGGRVLVMYWYQLDEHILFDRLGLGLARVEMRNKETWPALVKVLLQTSAADPEAARERIDAIARETHQWINQGDHQPTSGGPTNQASVAED